MTNKKNSLIYGRHPVIEAIKKGTTIDKVYLQQQIRGEYEKELRHLCRDFDIPLKVVPKDRLNKFTRNNHQGVLAVLSLITYQKLEDILPFIFEHSETPLILLLDGVTDVRNFGAIARSAVCCGVHAIVIPSKGSAQINADAIKSSAGALLEIPVCRESSLFSAIEFLNMSGVSVFASELGAKELVYDIDFKIPCGIVMGSEDKGVSRSILNKVDQRFVIPQKGNTDSFNVSVASGIILYEAYKQRLLR